MKMLRNFSTGIEKYVYVYYFVVVFMGMISYWVKTNQSGIIQTVDIGISKWVTS